MTREEILAELANLGVDLGQGSVYKVKTLRTVSFDFYEDGGRYGLCLSWFESERVTAKIIAEGIKELKCSAHKITNRHLWIPSAGEMFLWESTFEEPRWIIAPWLLP